jgi:hypothetical protein
MKEDFTEVSGFLMFSVGIPEVFWHGNFSQNEPFASRLRASGPKVRTGTGPDASKKPL